MYRRLRWSRDAVQGRVYRLDGRENAVQGKSCTTIMKTTQIETRTSKTIQGRTVSRLNFIYLPSYIRGN